MSLAMAYSMKRRSKAKGGDSMDCTDCASGHCMTHGGSVHEDGDIVDRIMAKRMSKGGRVSNQEHGKDDEDLADFSPNEFDDLVLRDDLEAHDTDANSGDELDDEQENEDRRGIVTRIMKSRRLKAGSYPGAIKGGL